MKLNPLTPEEENVIVRKATEPPFSGQYDSFFYQGSIPVGGAVHHCTARQISLTRVAGGRVLMMKFREALIGLWTLMADEQKFDVQCVEDIWGMFLSANGRLQKNTRHCVNSLSLKFVPDKKS